MFVIKATTPEEVRKQICNWLIAEAINYSSNARIANRKRLAAEYRVKSTTLAAAAKFISEAKIINE